MAKPCGATAGRFLFFLRTTLPAPWERDRPLRGDEHGSPRAGLIGAIGEAPPVASRQELEEGPRSAIRSVASGGGGRRRQRPGLGGSRRAGARAPRARRRGQRLGGGGTVARGGPGGAPRPCGRGRRAPALVAGEGCASKDATSSGPPARPEAFGPHRGHEVAARPSQWTRPAESVALSRAICPRDSSGLRRALGASARRCD